ncbi:Rossmann fold domain-containing protein [Novosphingobium aquiterrae]|uniref:Rossmann fold domain-containing protein n=1 Tax=Novosphingobium aquiterrae TaxID=624388 RepID=A0ABV6PL02_9SPHN
MDRLDITGLPEDPLAAAAHFYSKVMPGIGAEGDLTLVFPAADHTHRAWRLAAIEGLARARVPGRINAVSGGNSATIAAALAYLAAAPGVTGQYLPLDDSGAGGVIPSSP